MGCCTSTEEQPHRPPNAHGHAPVRGSAAANGAVVELQKPGGASGHAHAHTSPHVPGGGGGGGGGGGVAGSLARRQSFSSIRPPLQPQQQPPSAAEGVDAAGASPTAPGVGVGGGGGGAGAHAATTTTTTTHGGGGGTTTATSSALARVTDERVSVSLSSIARGTGADTEAEWRQSAAYRTQCRLAARGTRQRMDEFGFLRPVATVDGMLRAHAALTEHTAREHARVQLWRQLLSGTDFDAHTEWLANMPLATAENDARSSEATQNGHANGQSNGDVKHATPPTAGGASPPPSSSSSSSSSASAPAASALLGSVLHGLPAGVAHTVRELVVRDGVPHELRGLVWSWALGVRAHHEAYNSHTGTAPPPHRYPSYTRLLTMPSDHDKQIRLDIGRTFGHHPYFGSNRGRGQLFRILHCWSLVSGAAGYVQGMNYVLAVMLMALSRGPGVGFGGHSGAGGESAATRHVAAGEDGDEQHAFWLLCSYMHGPRLHMAQWYGPRLEAVTERMARFDAYVRVGLPRLHAHFVQHDMTAVLFASPWWLTLFVYNLPVPTVVRLWDALFLLGNNPPVPSPSPGVPATAPGASAGANAGGGLSSADLILTAGLVYAQLQQPRLLRLDFSGGNHLMQNLRVSRRPLPPPHAHVPASAPAAGPLVANGSRGAGTDLLAAAAAASAASRDNALSVDGGPSGYQHAQEHAGGLMPTAGSDDDDGGGSSDDSGADDPEPTAPATSAGSATVRDANEDADDDGPNVDGLGRAVSGAGAQKSRKMQAPKPDHHTAATDAVPGAVADAAAAGGAAGGVPKKRRRARRLPRVQITDWLRRALAFDLAALDRALAANPPKQPAVPAPPPAPPHSHAQAARVIANPAPARPKPTGCCG